MGKGYKGKGYGNKGAWKGKGGKKGDGKNGKNNGEGCHWCGKPGHKKTECKEFEKWKKDKDEERKKKGLPPFQPRNQPRGLASMEPEGSGEAAKQEDYVGFDYDAGSLEFGGIDAVEIEEQIAVPEVSEEWRQVRRRGGHVCGGGACCTPAAERRAYFSNMFQAISESDYEDIDCEEQNDVDYEAQNDEPTVDVLDATSGDFDPWKSWNDSSEESMVAIMQRERKELEQKIKNSKQVNSEKHDEKAMKPPGLPAQGDGKAETRSAGPWESALMRRQSKPQSETGISMGTQTEIHLEHQVKSITWIPVVDTVEPVHDIDDDFYDEPENNNTENVNKIDNGMKEILGGEPGDSQGQGNVNDVDSLEVVKCDQTETECDESEPPVMVGSDDEEWEPHTMSYCYLKQYRKDENEDGIGAQIIMIAMVAMFMIAYVMKHMNGDSEEEGASLCPVEASETESGARRAESENRRALKPGGIRAKLQLKRGITLDSGAHHNVMPRRLVNKRNIRPSIGSRNGMHYIAANKGRIPNEGEVEFKFQTLEGEEENWLFQIAEVNKALGAIADRVDNNYRVVFDKNMATGHDSSYILNKATNKILKSTRVGNVWVIEAIINAEDAGTESFVRLG